VESGLGFSPTRFAYIRVWKSGGKWRRTVAKGPTKPTMRPLIIAKLLHSRRVGQQENGAGYGLVSHLNTL